MSDRYLEHCIAVLKQSKDVAEDGVNCVLSVSSVDCIIDLLKEQEAIKPYRHYARCGTNHKGMDFWYNCGSCKAEILENDKYCHECGQAVEWDD